MIESGSLLPSGSIFLLRFLHLQINNRIRTNTAVPAMLLTTLPMIIGVGVAESSPELVSLLSDVLVEGAPVAALVPPATKPPKPDVASPDEPGK